MDCTALAHSLQDIEARFIAEPPRIPAGRAIAGNHDLLWSTVIAWVETHHHLIAKITGGLRDYFPGNVQDIRSLALLVAFETLQSCAGRGQIDQFVPAFCRRFRNALIEQCSNVPVDRDVLVELLPDPDQSPYFPAAWPQSLSATMRRYAFKRMLPNQVLIWEHFLDGWNPTSGNRENTRTVGKTLGNYYVSLHAGIDRVARKVRKEQP